MRGEDGVGVDGGTLGCLARNLLLAPGPSNVKVWVMSLGKMETILIS